jgi:protein-disulfide isomerase
MNGYNAAMSENNLIDDVEPVKTARRVRPTAPQWPQKILAPILLGAFLFGAGMLTGWYLRGQETSAAAAVAPPSQGIQIPENVNRYDVDISGHPSIGPDDAPVTLVEFSDYECPYCKRWHDQVFTQILAEYGDRVKFVYRNMPIIGRNAVQTAQAAYCAGEQNAYWEYHDALFTYRYDFGGQAYELYARDLGLDAEALLDCLNSGRYADEVEQDLQAARDLGISSTPTFFVNGIPIVGAQPYSVFKQIIDLELAGDLPRGE